MKKMLLLVVQPLLTMSFLLFCGNVAAQCTITYASGSAGLPRTCSGQSFTPTCSADLVTVRYLAGGVPDRVDIHEGNGPSGTLLYSNTAAEFVSETHTLTSPVPLTSGSVYTVLFIRTGSAANANHFYHAAGASYPGGSLWGYNGVYGSGAWGNFTNFDLRFTFTLETFVPLPVALTHFTAHHLHTATQLDWQTASEVKNEGFHLQRSPDGITWNDLAFVPGNGTTTETHDYSFLDENPFTPLLGGCKGGCTIYYRLRQTDFDGKSGYSSIVSVEVPPTGSHFRFSPNPAPQGVTSLYFSEAPEAGGVLEIFDGMGRRVYRQTLQLESDLSIPVDLSTYPPGIYTARLALGGELRTERLVVTK